jgi:hypothetical protein
LDIEIKTIFTDNSIIDKKELENMPQVIDPKEAKIFGY